MRFMSEALDGKCVLITGASSGLGAYFAELVASQGATVYLAARRKEALDHVAERISDLGAKVSTIQLDVTRKASIEAALNAIGSIDVLVNNAGVVRESPALEQTEADWDAVLDTNLKGMFFTAQAVATRMRESGGGAIVNIASILGLRQAGGVVSYAASKAGVIQMTKVLALEWARYGIRVNSLAPGYIRTDINRDFWETDAGRALIRRIPQRRLGELDDLAGPFLLLASDASRYMTGSTLVVDGGHLVGGL